MTGSLQQFVEEVNGMGHLRIEHDFGGGFVRLCTSEAERRQAQQDIRSSEDILIELLRNARDAEANHIFVATWKDGDTRHFTVIDDGIGIRPSMHEHIFEPRVTSKLDTSHIDKWGMHGRGMALYSIFVNASEAKVATSDENLGTSIVVSSNVRNLGEKTDQSSFPTFQVDANGVVTVRGPKNILRTACEFAIEERRICSVFLGSQTEVLATLLAFGMDELSPIDRAFCRDVDQLPVAHRIATAADPDTFSRIAVSIGIPISSRSARRILDGQIDALPQILKKVSIKSVPDKKQPKKQRVKSHETTQSARLSRSDSERIKVAAMGTFRIIAQEYYLDPDVEAHVKQHKGSLSIDIPLVEKTDDDVD